VDFGLIEGGCPEIYRLKICPDNKRDKDTLLSLIKHMLIQGPKFIQIGGRGILVWKLRDVFTRPSTTRNNLWIRLLVLITKKLSLPGGRCGVICLVGAFTKPSWTSIFAKFVATTIYKALA